MTVSLTGFASEHSLTTLLPLPNGAGGRGCSAGEDPTACCRMKGTMSTCQAAGCVWGANNVDWRICPLAVSSSTGRRIR
eukprot:gene9784-biopygen7386